MSEAINFNVPNCLVARLFDEGDELPEYRSEFMRDRDRIMYATAFRRLSGKTQIYTVGRDDHKKNRLTHTLEVSQIARTVATALNFNPELAEAIALGHDFGHTPFGHAGERMLHEILVPDSRFVKKSPFYNKSYEKIKDRFERESKEYLSYLELAFGFKHNLQSVRVMAQLEDSYRNNERQNIGLNLTNFSLYGIMNHSNQFFNQGDQYPNFQNHFSSQMKLKDYDAYAWSFESDIVRWADDIAQWHHDLEDAMREGVLPLHKICDTIRESLQGSLDANDSQKLDDVAKMTRMDRKCIADLSHIVVNTLVNNLVDTSRENLAGLRARIQEKDADVISVYTDFEKIEFEIARGKIITVSDKVNIGKFKEIIRESIHHSRNVERMNEKGRYIIRKLFEAYYTHPQQLPDGPILHLLVDLLPEEFENIDKAREVGIGEARVRFEKIIRNPNIYTECMLMRRVCDHIASMTDHYAIDEYNNLYG